MGPCTSLSLFSRLPLLTLCAVPYHGQLGSIHIRPCRIGGDRAEREGDQADGEDSSSVGADKRSAAGEGPYRHRVEHECGVNAVSYQYTVAMFGTASVFIYFTSNSSSTTYVSKASQVTRGDQRFLDLLTALLFEINKWRETTRPSRGDGQWKL